MERKIYTSRLRWHVVAAAWVISACCVKIRGCKRVTDGRQEVGKVGELLTGSDIHPAGSLFNLARERFEDRRLNGTIAVREEEWTFNQVQLVRVPKAASTTASALARRLAGCMPYGPCCHFPGDPPGSCPVPGLMCTQVTGCAGHDVGEKEMAVLLDSKVFSMSNLRDVPDRLVSGFFYTAPHSPTCARQEIVTRGITCRRRAEIAFNIEFECSRYQRGSTA